MHNPEAHIPQELKNQANQHNFEVLVEKNHWLLTDQGKVQSLLENGTGFRGNDYVVITQILNPIDKSDSFYLKFFRPEKIPQDEKKLVAKEVQGTIEHTHIFEVKTLDENFDTLLSQIGQSLGEKYHEISKKFSRWVQELTDTTQTIPHKEQFIEHYTEVAHYFNSVSIDWMSHDWHPSVLQKLKMENGKWVPDLEYIPQFSLPEEVMSMIPEIQSEKYHIHTMPSKRYTPSSHIEKISSNLPKKYIDVLNTTLDISVPPHLTQSEEFENIQEIPQDNPNFQTSL